MTTIHFIQYKLRQYHRFVYLLLNYSAKRKTNIVNTEVKHSSL